MYGFRVCRQKCVSKAKLNLDQKRVIFLRKLFYKKSKQAFHEKNDIKVYIKAFISDLWNHQALFSERLRIGSNLC